MIVNIRGKRETGLVASVNPRRNGHGHNIKDLVAFKIFVDKNQGRTAKEMAKEWGNITPTTIRKWLHRIGIGYTRKKKFRLQRAIRS